VDIWNAYEVSWLDSKGKPCVAIVTLYVPANSKYLVESKSLKLYFNSFNNNKFGSLEIVKELIEKDLSYLLESGILVVLKPVQLVQENIGVMPGGNIDHLEVACTEYDTANPKLIKFNNNIVTEEINSNLLKSNCLITNQPDWGSVSIKYTGKQLEKESIIQYIVSLRNHNEFHEQCVERIFYDINRVTEPEYLSVYARYTRRGGIDICPYRTSDENFSAPANVRMVRQ
jgi:7-cyano-7-deazaguanine reductase